jgi:predicted transposase YbfD/YdcC
MSAIKKMTDLQGPARTFRSFFEAKLHLLIDPRRTDKGNIKYTLGEILFLAIAAALSGANTWTAVEQFGEDKLDWLRRFFPYENGAPSHDAISKLFAALDPIAFEKFFAAWISGIAEITEGEVVAVDGKTQRSSAGCGREHPLHIVSAYAVGNRVCLGQMATDEKSNEITAIPQLLAILAIKACIVTIDAMGCQTEIAEKIIEKGADHVLMVKDNQKALKEQVAKVLGQCAVSPSKKATFDIGHGRTEQRTCTATEDLRFLDGAEKWKGIRSVAMVESVTCCKQTGKEPTCTRYYISSLPADAAKIAHAVRSHWAVENSLHWSLDVVFNEDKQMKRDGCPGHNFHIITKMALGMLEKETSKQISNVNKRYKAALNDEYREKLMGI